MYDITDPLVPSFVGVYSNSYIDNFVVIQRGEVFLLYAAAINDDKIVVIDVSSMGEYGELSEQVITEVEIESPSALAVSEDNSFLFVSKSTVSSAISIYSILNMHNVFYISSFALITPIAQYEILELVVRENYLWISASSAGVSVYDIVEPASPQFVAQYFTSTSENPSKGSWGVYPLAGNQIAYAADFDNGFWSLSLERDEPSTTPSFSVTPSPVASAASDASISPTPSFSLTVASPTISVNGTESEGAGLSNGEIIGIVVATAGSILILLCIVCVAAFCVIRWRMKKTHNIDIPELTPEELSPDADDDFLAND